MAKYTILGDHEIHLLAQRYSLEVSEYSIIEGGASNSSYLLRANGDTYVLTIADDKSVDEVIHLVGVLDHLIDHEFPTSSVIPSKEKEKITIFEDKAVYVKKYIPGDTVKKIPHKGLFSLGMKMARLHQIPAPGYIPQSHPYGADKFHKAIGLNFDSAFEKWLTQMGDLCLSLESKSLPRGLIHADVFWDNVLFLDGEFQALIDFEDTCKYYLVYDLGCALIGTCIEAGKLNLDKASQIIKGYEQIRVLEEDERKSLQFFAVYAGAAISNWRYMKYNLHNPTEEKKHLHKEMADIASGVHAIPPERFMEVFV